MARNQSSSLHTWCLLSAVFLSTSGADLIEGQTDFSDKILPFLYEDASTNDCTSALGVSMAFSLVYPSMVNEAKTQTQAVFGFPVDNTQLVWADTEAALEEAHNGTCPKLVISNSVWLNSAQTTNPNYTSVVQDHVREIEFADAAAGGIVNDWVNASTRGLIDSIVDDGALSGVQMVAINTIYLKARWRKAFKEMFTSRDLFYASPVRATVNQEESLFMHMVDFLPYAQTDTHQVVSLPFLSEGNTLSMTIALPFVEDQDLMSSDEMTQLDMQSTAVALALPKFKFSSTYSESLQAALMSVGLDAPFQGGLCVYDGNCNTGVDKIIQKTFIALDEEGVEAAAVTAIGGRNLPFYPDGSIEFLADHPFQFFIHETNTNVVLFEGRVVSPEAEGEPRLAATHTRSGEFWANTFRVTVQQMEAPAVSITNQTMPSAMIPTNNQTTSSPVTVPANNQTASTPTTIPANNETSTPITIPVKNETSTPITIPANNETSTPITIPAGNETSLPITMPASNQTLPPLAMPANQTLSTTMSPTSSPSAMPTTTPVMPEQLPEETTRGDIGDISSAPAAVCVNMMAAALGMMTFFFL